MIQGKTAKLLLLSSTLALSLPALAQAQRSTRQVSLPQGTVLRAELNDRLSSVDNRPGDHFTATLRPETDGSGLPSGSQVIGEVTSVRRASDNQPGTVDVAFQTLKLPDGRTYPIQASLSSLDSDSVRRTSSGRLESRSGSSSKNNTKFIGYGAGAGALIGALSHGNLLMSALLGAAGGYLYGQLNKDKADNGHYADVNLKTGTEFGVRLNQDMVASLPYDRAGAYNSGYSNSGYRSTRTDQGTSGYYNRNRGSDIRVLVNERDMSFGASRPFMSQGRVMVPLAQVMDNAGYRYDYDSADRAVTVYGRHGDARLVIGDNYATVDGRRVRMDVPAQRIDGVIYVPSQFLEEATDIRADWDADQRVLRLTSPTRASFPGFDNRDR